MNKPRYGRTPLMGFQLKKIAPELAVAYSQLKQSMLTVDQIPLGSIGTLVEKQCNPGSDKTYLYRAFNSSSPPKKTFDLVAAVADVERVAKAREEHEFFKRCRDTLKALNSLGYPFVDKTMADVMVSLFNNRLLGASDTTLVVVGTAAYSAILSDLGLAAVSVMTNDLDLAVTERLEVALTQPFDQLVKRDMPDFNPIPGMPSNLASTSLKDKGPDGMHLDVLTSGRQLGAIKPISKLNWHAQAIPYLDYLVQDTRVALSLSTFKAIPVRVPDPIRFAFHKCFSSQTRVTFDADKKDKDRRQAIALIQYFEERDEDQLQEQFELAPAAIQNAVSKTYPAAWNNGQADLPSDTPSPK